jgi:threonine synthase
MKFISTRGQAPEAGFAEILLAGLAPDGGLYMPVEWPKIDVAEIAGKPYREAAHTILRRFVGDSFDEDALKADIDAAYAGFDDPRIAPLRPLYGNVHLLELFHGPTLAFKDIALQVLGRLFARALAKRGGRATVVAATSGDTGSAAIDALGGLPNVEVFVLHPKGRVTDVQRRQMTTSTHANVHNIALEGSFDEAQAIVKALFADVPFAQDIGLTAVNSINFARIAAQTVYYFTATAQLGRPAAFIVPTGNFGDAFAGEAAARMGLRLERVIAATNANDMVARAIAGGVYEAGEPHHTLSPSMDIQVASNFERALFEASGRDDDWVRRSMEGFARERRLLLPEAVRARLSSYRSFSVSDQQTLATIRYVFERTGRLIDPHTAVAASLADARTLEGFDGPVVVLSTAHPAKFPQAVARAAGQIPPLPPRLSDLFERKEKFDVLPPHLHLVRTYIAARVPPP